MAKNPELDDFERRMRNLPEEAVLGRLVEGDEIKLGELSLGDVNELVRHDVGYYFLVSAAGLNRTSLKRAMSSAPAKILKPEVRKAFALKEHLPLVASLGAIVEKAVALRERDLRRKRRGAVEELLRERLEAEGIPLLMSPPVRRVPGLLIRQRKPDGVYPDPATGKPPKILLEVKSIRRVSDDIQKRLYEIAETSLEMKALYGRLRIVGFDLAETGGVVEDSNLRQRMRRQITESYPVVVAFFICPRADAERYREGAEAFIDRVFFQEEVEDCIEFLREIVESLDALETDS